MREASDKVAKDWNKHFAGADKVHLANARTFNSESRLYCPRKIQKTKDLFVVLQVTSFHFNAGVCRVHRKAEMTSSDAYVRLSYYCSQPIYGNSCHPKGGISLPVHAFLELIDSPKFHRVLDEVECYTNENSTE